MKFEEAVVVRELIDRVREQTGAKRLIFCGSSKGGYTALNFGLDYPGSYMVVGGPQYFLGQSLLDTGNIEALKHIAGQVCKERSNSSMSIFRKGGSQPLCALPEDLSALFRQRTHL